MKSESNPGIFGIYFLQVASMILGKLKKDVNQSPEKSKPLHLKSLHSNNVVLHPMGEYPKDFADSIEQLIVDKVVLEELSARKVINWCRTAKHLTPLITTGDGNCLLHAISLYVLGIEDSDLCLRRLLYNTLASDESLCYKQRWLCEKKLQPDTLTGLRLNSQEWDEEWNLVCRLGDDTRQNNPNGLPYSSLEEIHVFVMANILRRPIIVLCEQILRSPFGTSLQHNNLGGIYLPLQWRPQDCCRTPIVLCYRDSHFTPLVSQADLYQESVNAPQAEHVVPIVHSDQSPLKLHFVLPQEEASALAFLKDYLKVMEVPGTTSDGIDMIPAAKLNVSPSTDELNIVREFFKLKEREYHSRKTTTMLQCEPDARPFQETAFPLSTMNAMNDMTGIKCATKGCKMAGSQETNNLCSKCFSEFSRRDAELEAEKRRGHKPVTAPLIDVQPLDESRQIQGETRQFEENNRTAHVYVKQSQAEECVAPACRNQIPPGVKLCPVCVEKLKSHPNQMRSLRSGKETEGRPVNNQATTATNLCHTPAEAAAPDLTASPIALKRTAVQSQGTETAQSKVEHYLQLQQLEPPAIPPVDPMVSLSPTEKSKHICATPGCEGLRLKNPHGMCHTCYESTVLKKKPIPNQSEAWFQAQAPDPTAPLEAGLRTPDSQLVESALTNPLTGELIVSENQKQECVGPLCTNKVSPPKKLCDACTHVLAQAVTQNLGRCHTPNCEFHGSPEFKGYCSKCFNKSKRPAKTGSSASTTEPIAIRSQHQTALFNRNLAVVVEPRNHSAPLFSRGRPCLTPGCTRFGDPAMDNLCTRCYERSRSVYKTQSTGRIERAMTQPPRSSLYQLPAPQRSSYVVPSASGQGVYMQGGRNELVISSGNEFHQNMSKLEGLFKTKSCRSPGCSNFGSSARQGYCSTCYNMRRGEDVVDCM